MSRIVTLPPNEPARGDGIRAGGWWHESADGRKLVCDLCPRACALGPGDRGFCFVRQNLQGQIVSTTYGRSTGFCIDPIEKKPLNHFYPGTAVLSFGTAGCNLGCKFCQNWSISKSREIDSLSESAEPETIAEAAQQLGCRSVAFTYNDPVIWAEYAIDTARACRAAGVKTVAVTAGYITPTARTAFYDVMDAANVDLKGFSEGFYWKLTGGHLDPVRDTLRWLARETDVWVEITNLIIPQANDSADELARMCDWIVDELGPDVPVHFTAFHPDFRLRDRGPTPPATLAAAHDIARRAGIRYAYTGNVSDQRRQSTYCPGCQVLLIERDGYHLGVYALEGHRCRQCGHSIAGRFDDAPGQWGPRRQPVRISQYARPKPVAPQGESAMTNVPSDSPAAAPGGGGPRLTADQEQLVFRAAGRRVAAAVHNRPAGNLDELLGPVAETPLLGAFVSLKRAGQLRSCCGFLGQPVRLFEAIDHAGLRAAKEDPRFPPIAAVELPHLDMEVWLLWGMERVTARGDDRVSAVVVGKHGLHVQKGDRRGLLLPGVATEHGFDAQTFLEQTCRKAGLPRDAWRDDDTVVMTFQGHVIGGPLGPSLAVEEQEAAPGGPSAAELTALAEFCRQNLVAQYYGATPSFYLSGGFDGQVSGAALVVHLPNTEEKVQCSRMGVRQDLPLQATLFDLVKGAAGNLASRGAPPDVVERATLGLTILWEPAMQGTVAQAELTGVRRRALMAIDSGRWAVAYDPSAEAETTLALVMQEGRFAQPAEAALLSFAAASTEPRVAMSNVPTPQAGAEIRPPAVAGRFYPGSSREIEPLLDELLGSDRQAERWAGAIVPHAGWIYSGRLAAEVFNRIEFPGRVIVVCPKHHRDGANWAVAPHRTWGLPGRQLASDPELAAKLAGAVTGLELDAAAHRAEHAIEVQLPFIARLAPEASVVGMAIHGGDWLRLREAARQMAGVLCEYAEPPLLVVSTDMNHYLDDAQTRRIDRMALDAIEALDPERLLSTVKENGITMCGVLPAVLVMQTLRELGVLNRCQSVGYATSADSSGDKARVVGYAGMLFA